MKSIALAAAIAVIFGAYALVERDGWQADQVVAELAAEAGEGLE